MRTRYLLCYDIRDDRRLRRTAKVAEGFGHRLQYSVFVCDLSVVDRTGLERGLRDVIDVAVDRVLLVDLGSPSGASRLRWISHPDILVDPSRATIV